MSDNIRRVSEDLEKEEREQLHRATLALSQQSFETKRLLITVLIAVATVCGAVFRDNYRVLVDNRIPFCLGLLVIILLFWIMDGMTNFYTNRLRYHIDKMRNQTRKSYRLSRGSIHLERVFGKKLSANKLLHWLRLHWYGSKIWTFSFISYYVLSVIVISIIPLGAVV